MAPIAPAFLKKSAEGTPPEGSWDAAVGLPRSEGGFVWQPLTERPATELRAHAADYRRMAEGATTLKVMSAFFRVAIRLEALAQRRASEESGEL